MTMDEIIIKNRCLTLDEAKTIRQEIRETPNLTGYSLHELLGFSNVFVSMANKHFAGMIANINFAKNWTEISAFVVLEKYRGQGIGRKLFDSAYIVAEETGKNIFIVSRNPVVIKMMEAKGSLTLANSLFKLPWAIVFFEFKAVFSWYRITEYFRKFFTRRGSSWVFGYRINADR